MWHQRESYPHFSFGHDLFWSFSRELTLSCLDGLPVHRLAYGAAKRDIPRGDDGSLPTEWLLAEWPTGATAPTDYSFSTLDETSSPKELVRIAKIRWRIEHDYRELKTGLGLAYFEVRTLAGWHRHLTLVTAAHLFITTLRLTRPKVPGAA